MPSGGPNSERALILAPHGRDAEIASKLLQDAGWATSICADFADLRLQLENGAALSIVVEEAIATGNLACFAEWIGSQPAWSDFPVVVLTGRVDAPGRNVLANRLQDLLGNVTFLERPFHPSTLVSLARSALRSRRRQYQTRELLEQQDLLARELQHRTKNLLAVTQSIAFASLRQSQERDAFLDRLLSLARAQDLIMRAYGRGALMKDVVEQSLEGFTSQVILEGPQVLLNPTTAQGFALLLHELATNAAKHGALTVKSGTVSVRWSIDTSSADATFVFRWQERGGPPVTPPKHKGFGAVLLKRAVANTGAPPHFEYSREGFTYELRAPLANSIILAKSVLGQSTS